MDNNYTLMQQRIANTYIDMAYELNAWCAPVGLAWMKVRECFPDIELYIEDDFHPSLAGSWLAANTLFATLYQQRYETAAPEGLTAGEGAILQRVAEQSVFDNAELLNIDSSEPTL